MRKRISKLFVVLVKYIPVIAAIVLWAHTGICILGYTECILDNLFRVSLCRAIFMMVASYAFNFCRLHRHFIIYNFVASTLMTINEEWGLGYLLLPCELFTLITGTVLFTSLIIHLKKFNGGV